MRVRDNRWRVPRHQARLMVAKVSGCCSPSGACSLGRFRTRSSSAFARNTSNSIGGAARKCQRSDCDDSIDIGIELSALSWFATVSLPRAKDLAMPRLRRILANVVTALERCAVNQ